MSRPMRVLVLCCVLLAPTTAVSREKGPLTAEEFVAQALAGPAAQAIDRRVDVQAGKARGAGLWPNPSASWSRESLPGSGVAQSTQDIVWLSVPIVLSGRTFAESEAAGRTVEAAHFLRISRRAALRRQATVLFYRALVARRKRELAEATRVRFGDVASILEKRAAVGETSGYDAIRLEVERATVEDRVAAATLELAAAKAEMEKVTGVEVGILTGELASQQPDSAGVEPPLGARLKALEAQVKAARARREAAGRRAVPDPTVGIGIQRQGGEGSDVFLGYFIGVRVPLPVFDHGQGPAAEAAALTKQLAAERSRLLVLASASLAEARRRLAVGRARLKRQATAADRAVSLLDIARKGYSLGGVGLLTLLDAERTALDVQLRAAGRAFDVRRAEADVLFLTGAYDEQGGAR